VLAHQRIHEFQDVVHGRLVHVPKILDPGPLGICRSNHEVCSAREGPAGSPLHTVAGEELDGLAAQFTFLGCRILSKLACEKGRSQ
jgi:hypothetical protein